MLSAKKWATSAKLPVTYWCILRDETVYELGRQLKKVRQAMIFFLQNFFFLGGY